MNPEEYEKYKRELHTCQDQECLMHCWKIGRSDEVVNLVGKLEDLVWGDFYEEGPKELTDFQRGYLLGEITHIKKGGRPCWNPSDFDDTLLFFKMFCIDCPP